MQSRFGHSSLFTAISLVQLSLFASAQGPSVPPPGSRYHGVGWAFGGTSVVTEYVEALTNCSIGGVATADAALINPGMDALPGRTSPGTAPLDERVAIALARADEMNMIPQISISFQDQQGASSEAAIIAGTWDNLIRRVGRVIHAWDGELFIRLGFEFNAPHNPYTAQTYVTAYRHVVDGLRSAGVDKASFIWCYFPGGPADYLASSGGQNLWYPGHSYVDWWGLDLFFASQFLPTEPDLDAQGNLTTKGKAYLFLQDAAALGFPVMLSEVTAAGVDVTPGVLDGTADWNSWFAPFFSFMENNPVIRGYVYLNQDWSSSTNPSWITWGDARIQENPEVIVPSYAARVTQPGLGYWNGPTQFSCGF